MDENAAANEPAEQPEAAESAMSSMIDSMGQGERLLALGAGLAVLNYVLFEVILEDYFFTTTLLLVSTVVLFAMWVKQNRPNASWPIPYRNLLWASGLAAGFLGFVEFLTDIRRSEALLDESVEILGALVLYAACVLMVVGARGLKSSGD